MARRTAQLLLVLVALGAAAGTLAWRFLGKHGAAGGRKPVSIKLATTTSTENSGLLDHLLPAFKRRTGIEVEVIAVGTGKALRLGEKGDVDVLLVHAPAAESRFVEAGFGVNRREVMWNDFVIAGPASDPARIRGSKDAASALSKIARSGAPFASRGDWSGTHEKELELWAAAGIEPSGDWYLSTGQGMGPTLIVADEKQGYVLTDRGTLVAFEGKIGLAALCEGDPRLANPYGVIAVNPARHGHVKFEAATSFIDWLTSPEGREAIAAFAKNGKRLFFPGALPR